MLDASKAYDHVNYCKLFRISLDKKFVHYIIEYSFICTWIKSLELDGIQTIDNTLLYLIVLSRGGGGKHPVFCNYMGGLLNELWN